LYQKRPTGFPRGPLSLHFTVTAGGLTTPVDWTQAHDTHIPPRTPFCGAGVAVVGDHFVPRVVPGTDHVFTCFDPGSTAIVPPPAGTPGT